MSEKAALTHHIKTKRPTRIAGYNLACWLLGFFGGMLLIVSQHLIIEGLVIGGFIMLMGTPVKDAGSPPQWLMQQIERWRDRHKNGGIVTTHPLSRHGKKYESPWDGVQTVPAAIQLGSNVVEVPVITRTNRNYLTMILRVKNGAAGSWVSNDAEGKMTWDLRFIAALSRAVAVTNEASIRLAMGLNSRPSDRTYGYEYNNARIEESVLAAAESITGDGFSKTDKLLGDNAMEHFNSSHDQGGDTFNYVALRMPWPRTALRRRVKLENPEAFAATKFNQTIQALLIELSTCDLDIEPVSFAENSMLLDSIKNLRFIELSDTYRQRDRELVEEGVIAHIDDAPSAQAEAWRPGTIVSDPNDPGWIMLDGTFAMAGYAVALKNETVDPGFQIQSLVFPNDIFYTAATLIHVKRIEGEKFRAQEEERARKVKSGLWSFNEHLTKPDADREQAAIEKWRAELADAGEHLGEFHIPFVVLGKSVPEVRSNWNRVTIATARNYTLKPVTTPTEISDLMLATVAILD